MVGWAFESEAFEAVTTLKKHDLGLASGRDRRLGAALAINKLQGETSFGTYISKRLCGASKSYDHGGIRRLSKPTVIVLKQHAEIRRPHRNMRKSGQAMSQGVMAGSEYKTLVSWPSGYPEFRLRDSICSLK